MQYHGKLVCLIASAAVLFISACCDSDQSGDDIICKSPGSACTNTLNAAVGSSNVLDAVVFCVVDGEAITAQFVRENVLLALKVAELGGAKVPEKQIPALGNRYAMRITPGLISARLIENEARRCGIRATDSSDAQTLAKYNKATRSISDNKVSLARKFGELENVFLRQFDSESLRLAYFSSFPQLRVTDEDVELYYLNLTNTIHKLSKMEAESYNKAERAYNRLAAGEDWDSVARDCSEDAQVSKDNAGFSKEWGMLRLKDLQPVELAVAVAQLEVGKFTRPIETEDGLVIVKLVSRDDDAFDLARIFFRMPIRLEVPPREEAERRIVSEKCNDFQLELLPKLCAKAKLEYPLGTNFTYRIWDVPKREKQKQEGGQARRNHVPKQHPLGARSMAK